MNLYSIRLQALDWLFAAARPWLFQGENTSPGFPCGDDVDWKAVSDLGYFHNLEPLLYWVVSNIGFQTEIPEWLQQRWERAYFENFVKNGEYLAVLKVLLDKCERRGISIIVLKGPALIGRIYKDPALRTMSDLDILCCRSDLGGLVDMAREMGYETKAPGDDPAATQHVAMHNADSRSLLEFHFRAYEIIKDHQLFMQLAWERKEWVEIEELCCPALSLEMELVFNIAHIVQHQFDVAMKHLIDIAGLLISCRQKGRLDQLYSLLRSTGLKQEFILTVRSLEEVFDCPFLPHGARPAKAINSQIEFNSSLKTLLALLDEARLIDARGVIWNFRIGMSNRVGFREKSVYLLNALLPFSHDLALYYGIRSRSDIIRYCWRRFLFYLQRFIPTLANLPEQLLTTKGPTPALERATAKNRVTAQLSRVKVSALD